MQQQTFSKSGFKRFYIDLYLPIYTAIQGEKKLLFVTKVLKSSNKFAKFGTLKQTFRPQESPEW